jgi:hypothetical protein
MDLYTNYKNDYITTSSINSTVNWQLENILTGNTNVKIHKYLDTIPEIRGEVGVVELTYPYEKGAWYARKLIIQEGSTLIILYLTDKVDERRLQQVFENLRPRLKIRQMIPT